MARRKSAKPSSSTQKLPCHNPFFVRGGNRYHYTAPFTDETTNVIITQPVSRVKRQMQSLHS
ncbi:hypothetical protein, partial [uncultured Fibrobacter sp.]|uniref:hypothetical protein n=1 Tax=uncultured Fibrobacter sp. TaxID=261512 RepID=UPI002593884B